MIGIKPILIVVALASVFLGGYALVGYIKRSVVSSIELQIKETTEQKKEQVREAIKDSVPANRDDAADSLQWLRSRQSDSQ